MKTKFSILDKHITLWIFLSIFLGIFISYIFPNIETFWEFFEVNKVNIPIAIGLILMIYPPLVKVNYEHLLKTFKNYKLLIFSFLLNWFIGPFLMFFLAIIFLSKHPHFMIGLILIGSARCIAMVLVWNKLAKGCNQSAASLVAFNSIFQILFYSFYVYFFVTILPTFFGMKGLTIQITMWQVAKNVLIYLGIPFFLGFLTRILIIKIKDIKYLEKTFFPKISPITLFSLLFTVIVMFSFKGKKIIDLPLEALQIAIPLIFYFLIMFFITFYFTKKINLTYPQASALSFTAASNNFELAIAVAIGIFGISSKEAFATIIGPLVEVPLLISLVKVALFFKKRFFISKMKN